MRHSTGKPTRKEQERLDAIHDMPCIACVMEMEFGQLGDQPLPTEAHHLVDKGTRKLSGGHAATLPLCGWHHQGTLVYPLSSHEMRLLYGPSMKRSKRDFIAQYGTERELLEKVNEKLNQRNAA